MSMESLELNFSKIGYDGAIRFSESIHQQWKASNNSIGILSALLIQPEPSNLQRVRLEVATELNVQLFIIMWSCQRLSRRIQNHGSVYISSLIEVGEGCLAKLLSLPLYGCWYWRKPTRIVDTWGTRPGHYALTKGRLGNDAGYRAWWQ
jgi:hypothetical protein